MPQVILKVTLKNDLLDVDQAGNGNQISHGQLVTIIWHLVGNAAGGSFDPISGTSPGFAWIQPPPPGVFGTPELIDKGKQIQISDDNTTSNSTGSWIYQLRAHIDGKPYSTIASIPTVVITKNPNIKNN
jgi:hypothetical protein